MADNKPPIPGQKWVDYYLDGISIYYPNAYYSEKKGKTREIPDSKKTSFEKSVSKSQFTSDVLKATGGKTIKEALGVVSGWSSFYDKTPYPEQTTPGEIDLEEEVEKQEAKTPDSSRTRQEKTVQEWLDNKQEVKEVTVTDEDFKGLPDIYLVTKEKAEDRTITPDNAKKLANLIQASKEDSTKFADDLTKAIIVSAPKEYKETLSAEELQDTARVAAIRFTSKLRDLDDNANGIIQVDPNEIFAALSSPNNPELEKLIQNKNVRVQMAAAAQEIALTREREDINTAQLLQRVPEIGPELTSFFVAPTQLRSYSILSESEMMDQGEDTYAHKLGPENIKSLVNTYKQVLEIRDKVKRGEPVANIIRDNVLKNTIGKNPWYKTSVVTRVAGTTETVTPSFFGFGTLTEMAAPTAEALSATAPGRLIPYFASNGIELLTAESVASPVISKMYTLPLYGGLSEFGVGVIASESVITEVIGYEAGSFALGLGRTWIATSITPEYTFVIATKFGEKTLTGPLVEAIGTKLFGMVAPEAVGALGGGVVGGAGGAAGAAAAPAAAAATTGAELAAAPAAGTAVGGPVGFLIGLVVAAVAWVTTKLVPKVISWAKTHKEDLLIVPVGLITVGLAVGGVAGSVIVVTGLVSSAGYLTMMAGGVVPTAGLVGGGVYTVVQGFNSIIIPAIVAPLVIFLISIPLIVVFMVFILNAGAYVVPPPLSVFTEQGENPYIGVDKRADPPAFANSALDGSGRDVQYTITIAAKKTRLTNIRFKNECTVSSRDGGSPSCPPTDPEVPSSIPDEILPDQTFSFSYKQTFKGGSFANSSVTDIFTVTADSPDSPNTSASDLASVCIGDCPDECPSDWPILPEGGESYLVILSGPCVSTHYDNCLEAMDVDATVGHNLYATHSGKVTAYHTADTSSYGNYVTISSTCNGKSFYSLYAHMSTIIVGSEQTIKKGTIIGASGLTSSVPGFRNDHLHYEFSGQTNAPIKLVTPYVPRTIPRMCLWTSSPSCGTIP